jgi:hypothetical protein
MTENIIGRLRAADHGVQEALTKALAEDVTECLKPRKRAWTH